MGEPMLWRTRATSDLELLQRRQQRLELLVGCASAAATSARRAAALFSSRPTCRHWHCQNCTRFWRCARGLVLPGELFPHPCRQQLRLEG